MCNISGEFKGRLNICDTRRGGFKGRLNLPSILRRGFRDRVCEHILLNVIKSE